MTSTCLVCTFLHFSGKISDDPAFPGRFLLSNSASSRLVARLVVGRNGRVLRQSAAFRGYHGAWNILTFENLSNQKCPNLELNDIIRKKSNKTKLSILKLFLRCAFCNILLKYQRFWKSDFHLLGKAANMHQISPVLTWIGRDSFMIGDSLRGCVFFSLLPGSSSVDLDFNSRTVFSPLSVIGFERLEAEALFDSYRFRFGIETWNFL